MRPLTVEGVLVVLMSAYPFIAAVTAILALDWAVRSIRSDPTIVDRYRTTLIVVGVVSFIAAVSSAVALAIAWAPRP